jgi:hypothetical protein
VDRKRALTAETWPRRKPRCPRPAADACAAETHSANVSAAAEMSTASEVSTASKVSATAEVSASAAMTSTSAAMTSASAAASSSWTRVSNARKKDGYDNNGTEFEF